MRNIYIRCVVAGFLLAVVLTGCDDAKGAISVSSDAVSINDVSINSQTISNNNLDNIDNTEGAGAEEAVPASDAFDVDATSFASLKEAKIGDYVQFGTYEQDGDNKNGAEAIEWIVLDEYEDSILIFSRYVIDKKPFNDTDTAVYWSQSTLRAWLNDEFIDSAFSANEQEKIVASVLDNPGSSGYFADFEKNGGTATGNNTEDRVFLLSYADVLKYYEPTKVDKFYIYASKDLITTATVYSGIDNQSMSEDDFDTFYKEEGWPEDCVGVEGSGWFLRSHGFNSDDVMSVGYDGGIRGYYFTYGADYESVTFEGGVRPAMWVLRK